MTIKEVEQELRITRATIRFYEKEDLIQPLRGDNDYRDYSMEDMAILKKVIVLRKIGLSVSEIKDFLRGKALLPELMEKNVLKLQEQIEVLNGALQISKKIQERQEDIKSFDERYYWEEINRKEKAGIRFMDIASDTLRYEKNLILNQFGLADNQGNLNCKKGLAILKATILCISFGIVYYFTNGKTVKVFAEGFILPFIWILIWTIFGVPLFLLSKKHPLAAKRIKRIIICFALILVAVALILATIE